MSLFLKFYFRAYGYGTLEHVCGVGLMGGKWLKCKFPHHTLISQTCVEPEMFYWVRHQREWGKCVDAFLNFWCKKVILIVKSGFDAIITGWC